MISTRYLTLLTSSTTSFLQTSRCNNKLSTCILQLLGYVTNDGNNRHSVPCVSRQTDLLMVTTQTVSSRSLHVTLNCGISKKTYVFPELKAEDLKEIFVRGSGPGGQSVNKTTNCVVLQHIPTGVTVKCHETRSLDQNRSRARERLTEQVDFCLNGENSYLSLKQKENSLNRLQKKKKNKQRLELKKAFKEREGFH